MSHSTVTVICPKGEMEKTLEPFNEQREVEAYPAYEDPPELIEMRDGTKRWNWPYVSLCDERHPDRAPFDFADVPRVANELNRRWRDSGDKYLYDDDGLYTMSTYNPQSRWDWYQLGGRWPGMLLLRPGARRLGTMRGEASWAYRSEPDPYRLAGDRSVDACALGDVDWDAMRERQVDALRAGYVEYHEREPGDRRFEPDPWTPESVFPGDGEDIDAFVARRLEPFHTHALLLDGEWHERAQMGWFGFTKTPDVDDWPQRFHDLLWGADLKLWIHVVDVHI